MAKPIVVSLDGDESSFDHARVERSKLYGARKRVPLDADGNPCVKSALTSDGLYLLQSGMTAQGYFDEHGLWLQKSELQAITAEGQVLDNRPSTLGVAQPLRTLSPGALLECSIEAVYALDALTLREPLAGRLKSGEVFGFDFSYTADYHLKPAFLLQNADGVFCLVGAPFTVSWSEAGTVALAQEADGGNSDELDFEMF